MCKQIDKMRTYKLFLISETRNRLHFALSLCILKHFIMNLYSFPEEKIIIKLCKHGLKHRFVSSSNGNIGCV